MKESFEPIASSESYQISMENAQEICGYIKTHFPIRSDYSAAAPFQIYPEINHKKQIPIQRPPSLQILIGYASNNANKRKGFFSLSRTEYEELIAKAQTQVDTYINSFYQDDESGRAAFIALYRDQIMEAYSAVVQRLKFN